MKQPQKIIERKIEDSRRLRGYLGSSFDDYIAARILFNNNMLIQACCLANTALEKHFKAFVAFKGNTIKAKHNLKKLLPSVKDFNADLYKELNVNFLLELTKIYETRYIGDCPQGYNFAILRNKYLAELDYTYSLIEPKLRYTLKGKDIEDTMYEHFVKTKNPLIWQNNYILNNINRNEFIEKLDYVHELRIYNSHTLKFQYYTKESKNNGVFDFEGCKPIGTDNRKFTFSHMPYEEDDESTEKS